MRDRDSEERMGSEIGKGGEKEIEGRKEGREVCITEGGANSVMKDCTERRRGKRDTLAF